MAPCNVREVGNLMSDLKSRGMDLAAFEAKELFEVIKGRTLWCALLLLTHMRSENLLQLTDSHLLSIFILPSYLL